MRADVPVIHQIEPSVPESRIRQGVLNTYGFHSATQFERIHGVLPGKSVGHRSGQECVLNEGIALRAAEISVSTRDTLLFELDGAAPIRRCANCIRCMSVDADIPVSRFYAGRGEYEPGVVRLGVGH